MTLDDFFKGTKEAWEKEQRRLAEEAKAKEEQERRAKIAELKARRAGTTKAEPAAVPPRVVIPTGNFQIESLPDRYRLHNIQYNNGVYAVDWSKELLDDGKKHTQQDWIALTQSTEWKIPDLQLYHGTLAALYQHRDSPVKEQKKLVEELKQLFKADFDLGNLYMTTSTRIKYAASGGDAVTHNWGYPSAREHSLTLVGLHSYVNSSSGLEAQMEALLGNRDLGEIEKVYDWVSGKKPCLLRLEQVPKQDVERAAVLGCNYGRFDIYCSNIDYDWPSRGVVASRAEK